MKDNIQQLIVI